MTDTNQPARTTTSSSMPSKASPGTRDAAGRTVLITGAAGNLGSAVARAFAAQGDRLALFDQRAESIARACGPDGERQLSIALDLTDAGQVERAVQAVRQRFSRIDVLCNVAGGFAMGERVDQIRRAGWDALFDLNVGSLLNMAHAVVPPMIEQGGGRIINVGAFAAQHGAARMGAYIASKSAVIRLTETMAAELREHRINVNCVLPTIIDTPQNRAAMPDADPSRWVDPADIASTFVFLASDGARAIHGAAIPITGLS